MKSIFTILMCMFIFTGCSKNEAKQEEAKNHELMPIPMAEEGSKSKSFEPIKVLPAKNH